MKTLYYSVSLAWCSAELPPKDEPIRSFVVDKVLVDSHIWQAR
jgi:hypothetical protein